MKTLLKLNKSVIIVITLIVSLCLHSNYAHSQSIREIRDKVKQAKEEAKKIKDDIKKAAEEAKKIKNDMKGGVEDVKKVTGSGGSNGNTGSTGNSGSSGSTFTGTGISNEKYYRITNVATGQALTLVYDSNQALHKAIYVATIELKPVANASNAQSWHLYHGDRSATEDEEVVYTKVGHDPNGSGYTLWLGRADSSNNPDDKINYLKMYHNQSTSESLWHFQKLSNGYYRIFNEFAMPGSLNKRFEESRERWNEPRCFQAVTVGGKTKVKQMKNAGIDAQYWKLEELEYIPVNR
jgi:hypothetical protein